MTATVHVGPNGGTEYRLWTSASTFRIVGKFTALPWMTDDEKSKAAGMENARKASRKAEAERQSAWRNLMRGG